MGTYTGIVAKLVKGGNQGITTLLTGVSTVTVTNANFPIKFFTHGQYAVEVVDGVSGDFGVEVIGAVGGAQFPIAGRSAISAVGGKPLDTLLFTGFSGTAAVDSRAGFPMVTSVEFSGIASAGFTATVWFTGKY